MGPSTKNVVLIMGLLAGCTPRQVESPPAATPFCEAGAQAVGPACVTSTLVEVHGVRRPVSRVTIDGREVWNEMGDVAEVHPNRLIIVKPTFFEGVGSLTWGCSCPWEGQQYSLDCEPLGGGPGPGG